MLAITWWLFKRNLFISYEIHTVLLSEIMSKTCLKALLIKNVIVKQCTRCLGAYYTVLSTSVYGSMFPQ